MKNRIEYLRISGCPRSTTLCRSPMLRRANLIAKAALLSGCCGRAKAYIFFCALSLVTYLQNASRRLGLRPTGRRTCVLSGGQRGRRGALRGLKVSCGGGLRSGPNRRLPTDCGRRRRGHCASPATAGNLRAKKIIIFLIPDLHHPRPERNIIAPK